jgi:hypothetical protein
VWYAQKGLKVKRKKRRKRTRENTLKKKRRENREKRGSEEAGTSHTCENQVSPATTSTENSVRGRR